MKLAESPYLYKKRIASPLLCRVLFTAILIAYILIGVTYSILTPLWESPDEPDHLLYVRYLVNYHAFPESRLFLRNFPTDGEDSQAPLYYILGSFLTWGIDMGNLDQIQLNPYRTWVGHPAEHAMFEHTQDENYPWEKAALAGHIVRFLSVALGAAALVGIYLVARMAFPAKPTLALLSMALVAFNPGFVTDTSVINNDSLVAATSTFLLVLIGQALTRNVSKQGGLRIGLVLGLALLSKANALLLAPFALAPTLFSVGGPRARIRFSLQVIGGTLVTSAWWYAWNWWQFGTPMRKEAERMFVPDANWMDGLLPQGLQRILMNLFSTYWSYSGWTDMKMEIWVYAVLAVLVLVGLLGFLVACRRRSWRLQKNEDKYVLLITLLTVTFLTTVVIRAVLSRVPGTDHSRFLLPMIASSVLLARGLMEIGLKMRAEWIVIVISVVLGCFAALSPWTYIQPAFPETLPLWRGTVPAVPNHVSATVGSDVLLLGYRLGEPVKPDGSLKVTLYWQAVRDVNRDYHLFVYLLDPSGSTQAQNDGAALGGVYPTPRWRAGEVITEDRILNVGEGKPAGRYRIAAGAYTWPELDRLPVIVDGKEAPHGMAVLTEITLP